MQNGQATGLCKLQGCASYRAVQATGVCKLHTPDSEYVQSLYSVGAISYVCIVMCENIR